jgi:hypothetical protein
MIVIVGEIAIFRQQSPEINRRRGPSYKIVGLSPFTKSAL